MVLGHEPITRLMKTNTLMTLSIKNALKLMFFPVAVPFLVYSFVETFRKRFGFKLRPLEGKVVVITGASSGIGESLAKVFYNAGCKLILCSRRVDELERVKAQLVRSKTHGLVYIPAVVPIDLADLAGISKKSTEILQIYGCVDILINCAGLSFRGSVLDTNIDVHQRVMTVNYFSPLELSRCIAHSMVEKRQPGRVVFISSVQGKIAIPFRSAYSSSKHCIQALADSLRAELADLGVNVTVVSPGYVKTSLPLYALTSTGQENGEMDTNTASGYSPDYIAKRTMKAILDGQNEVIICSILPRIAIFLRNFWPNTFFWLMANRARKESNQRNVIQDD